MPICDDIIQQIATHMIDPIAEQSLRKLIYDFGLTDLFKNNLIVNTDYAGASGTKDLKNNSKLNHNRVECSATINLNPMAMPIETVTFKHSPSYGVLKRHLEMKRPIFQDPEPRIFLYEQEAPCVIQLQGEFVLLNKDIAYSVSSMFYNKFLDGSVYKHEHILFDYPLPKKTKYVLSNLWSYRDISDKIPFDDYLKICSQNQISLLFNKEDLFKNKDNPRYELIVQKTLMNALAKIEHSDERPNAEKQDRTTKEYRIGFTYILQFSRPNMTFLTYPIIIDNKELPAKLIPIKNNRNLRALQGSHNNIHVQSYFEQWVKGNIAYLQMPYYDDWSVPFNCPLKNMSYKEIIVGAFTLDEDKEGVAKEHTVININGDLSGYENSKTPFVYKLHEYMKQIIRVQCHGSFQRDCLFNISMFRNDNLIEPCEIEIDDNLNIWLPYTFKEYNYHMVISELKDLRYLNPKYYWLLEQYEGFFDTSQLDEYAPNWRESNEDTIDGFARVNTFRVLLADIYPWKYPEKPDKTWKKYVHDPV